MCVHSLITRLQLKAMSVMYESAHVAITFQLLEMSSITTPNQKQFRIFAQGTFFKCILGKISSVLPICIMKKYNLEVMCKLNRYWNSCKRLPNFVNVTALVLTSDFLSICHNLLMQLSITLVVRVINRLTYSSKGVKTLKNYNDTCLINFIIGWS